MQSCILFDKYFDEIVSKNKNIVSNQSKVLYGKCLPFTLYRITVH